MTDFIAYAVPNIFDFQISEHFYEKDYQIAQNRKMQKMGLKLGERITNYKEF